MTGTLEERGSVPLKAGKEHEIYVEFMNVRGPADGDEDEFGALVGAKQVETEEERAERERVSVSPS